MGYEEPGSGKGLVPRAPDPDGRYTISIGPAEAARMLGRSPEEIAAAEEWERNYVGPTWKEIHPIGPTRGSYLRQYLANEPRDNNENMSDDEARRWRYPPRNPKPEQRDPSP